MAAEEQYFRRGPMGAGGAVFQDPSRRQNGGCDFRWNTVAPAYGVCPGHANHRQRRSGFAYRCRMKFAISRKLYRSGESEYRINGNAVRLKDVHELFMDTGLGRDGYSMIGQGKIAEIIGAKSTSAGKFLKKPPESPNIATVKQRRSGNWRRHRKTCCV